jgi:DNA repair protein RecO (recombination protein O)
MTDAVVLHLFDYLESSRIVRVATRELGVQSVLARGARRPKSRFGSSLDVFASGVVQFTARPGRDLHNLTDFDLTRSRMSLAGNLERFAAASVLSELALAFAHPGPDDGVFDVLTQSLDQLIDVADGEAMDLGLAAAWQLIAALGFAPSLDACSVCRADIAPDEPTPFSHVAGGLLCAHCRTSAPVGRTLPPAARAALQRWLQGSTSPLTGTSDRRSHIRLLREFLQQHLSEGRELKALAAWEAGVRRRE